MLKSRAASWWSCGGRGPRSAHRKPPIYGLSRLQQVLDYPTLSDCLRNAKPGNPWLPFFHGTAQDPGICGTLETILRRLEVTNPSGLGSLKKRFGDDDEGNVFGLRTELLIGFKLAEAGIPFRFGGRAEPDVKCELTPEIWIEARTRSRDDVLLLQRDLRVALGNSPVNAILSFERRLAVSEGERNAIIRRVLEAVESRGTAHSISVPLPEIEGTCGIEPSPLTVPPSSASSAGILILWPPVAPADPAVPTRARGCHACV